MTPVTGNDAQLRRLIEEAIRLDAEGRAEDAVTVLKRGTVEFADTPQLCGYIAWFSLKLGQLEEAKHWAGRAVVLAPKSELASLVQFHALWESGEFDRASDEMKRFLSLTDSVEYRRLISEGFLGGSGKLDIPNLGSSNGAGP